MRTPLASLRFADEGITLLAKCEFLNPSGSIKDRFAKGVLADALQKGRLQPGRMFLCDTVQGRIVDDAEIKAELAAQHPYATWLDDNLLSIANLPPRRRLVPRSSSVRSRRQLRRRSCPRSRRRAR